MTIPAAPSHGPPQGCSWYAVRQFAHSPEDARGSSAVCPGVSSAPLGVLYGEVPSLRQPLRPPSRLCYVPVQELASTLTTTAVMSSSCGVYWAYARTAL